MATSLSGSGAPNRKVLPLLVITIAQLMLVLDDSIANVALPSIQRQFSFSASSLPWIVNAYVLAFGGLLLLGGRMGDLFGRLRIFRLGVLVFSLASVAGGFATNLEILVAARALQGVGAALAAPNALALISTNFPPGAARNKAMAVYGAMSALGITLGAVLGGVLTGALGWRWVFFINAPIALALLLGSRVLLEGERGRGKLGAIGAVIGTAAMTSLAYGITRVGEHGWTDPITLVTSLMGAALLAVFLAIQAHSSAPMLPLSLLRERNRAGSYAAMMIFGAGMMGTYYVLMLFLQQVLGFGASRAGIASLPFAAGIVLGAGMSSKLVGKLSPRVVATPGFVLGAAGMLWLSQLSAESSYFMHVLPGVFVVTFGLATSAIAMTLTAVQGVPEHSAGVASAIVNVAQQVGAALGIAAMTAVSTAASNNAARHALAAGYSTAFLFAAPVLLAAAGLVATLVNTRRTHSAPVVVTA